jgi:hypothetical protein
MISSTVRQGSLFYAAFGLQASLIKDDLLECVDEVLDDPALVALATEALAGRASSSATTGRYGMAPDRLLRACALKHIKNWSFRDLERELRASLLYRHFTRFDEADVPRYATFSRNFALLSPELVEQIHARVVEKARAKRVASGRKMRTDTTVVESNIHYPTDSTLLQDGVRVLTRSLKRLANECLGAPHIANHARTTKYRVLEIHRASKVMTDAGKAKLTEGYRKLCGIAQGVVRQAKKVTQAMLSGKLPIVGNPLQVLAADAALQGERREQGRAPRAREAVGDASSAAEAALVSQSAALAGGDRGPHRHAQAPIWNGARTLQRRQGLSEMGRLEHHQPQPCIHRTGDRAKAEAARWAGKQRLAVAAETRSSRQSLS